MNLFDLHVGDYFHATSGKIKYYKNVINLRRAKMHENAYSVCVLFTSNSRTLNVTHLLTGKHPWSTHGPLLRMVGLILHIHRGKREVSRRCGVTNQQCGVSKLVEDFFFNFWKYFSAHAFLNVTRYPPQCTWGRFLCN